MSVEDGTLLGRAEGMKEGCVLVEVVDAGGMALKGPSIGDSNI